MADRPINQSPLRSSTYWSVCWLVSSASVSSPPERRSSGRRPPSCSSPRRTPTDVCRPRCSPLGPPYTETRAAGSPTCSSGLKNGGGVKQERGWSQLEKTPQQHHFLKFFIYLWGSAHFFFCNNSQKQSNIMILKISTEAVTCNFLF